MGRAKITWLVAVFVAIGGVIAAIGGRSKSCAERYDCPAGETCAARAGGSFSCVAAGAPRAGDVCDATAGAASACGEHLACLTFGELPAGRCLPWCGSGEACPAGTTCQAVATTRGERMQVCR
jgi:hypothetical protein